MLTLWSVATLGSRGCTRSVSLTKLRLQSFTYENKNIQEEYTRRIYNKNLQEITGKQQKTKRKFFNTTITSKTNKEFERKTDVNRRLKIFTSRYIKIKQVKRKI